MNKINYQKEEEKLISQGCCTFSKRADQYSYNHPSHVAYSKGAKILGSDSKWYIDMVCGLGSNLVDIRNNFCKPSIYEVILAKEIKNKIKFIDKMKFLKTGSAACEASIRIARAYTKKSSVLGTGYHGCHNIFVAAEEPGVGTVSEGYEKFLSISDLILFLRNTIKINEKNDIAAVIVEPVQLDISQSVKKTLKELREICTENGIVLIFDEIITGFRTPEYCISQWWNIKPDLICFGKAIANGYPLAVVAGKKEIMDTNFVFISNTHNGEESAIKESLKTLTSINKYHIKKLWDKGSRFKNEINKILPSDKLQIVGYPTRGEWRGDDEFKAVFFEQMAIRGVILGRAYFITMAHDIKTLSIVLKAAEDSLSAIKKGAVRKGALPQAVFKRN